MNPFYKSALDKMKLDDAKKDDFKKLYESAGQEEQKMKLRHILRPVIATAACVAVAVAVTAVIPAFTEKEGTRETTEKTIGSETAETGGTPDSGVSENGFSIIAYARELPKNGSDSGKELTEGGKVYAAETTATSMGLCQDEKGRDISYQYDFPLRCEGKNIAKITYSLDNGFFMVSKKKGFKLGITGTRSEKKPNTPASGDEEGYFSSITMDYEGTPEANPKKYKFSITDDSRFWSKEKQEEFKDFHFDILESSPEETVKVMNFIMKDLGLKVTATYKDGSTETKNVVLSNELKSLEEIENELTGEDEKTETMDDTEYRKKMKEKHVFLTYSLE